MENRIKTLIRQLLPRRLCPHRIHSGRLRGATIVTSWHDYPAAILGYAETALTDWLVKEVRQGETWIDVGAHYGYTALTMCRGVGKEGRVFAFEPSLSSAGCIAQTRIANQYWWLTVMPFALNDSPVLRIQELSRMRGMVDSQLPLSEAEGSERFSSVALDAVWDGLCGGAGMIHGIKIDVQGMELQTLTGMRQLLCRYRPTVVLEIHAGVDRARILEIFRGCGYSTSPHPIESCGSSFLDLKSNQSFIFRSATS